MLRAWLASLQPKTLATIKNTRIPTPTDKNNSPPCTQSEAPLASHHPLCWGHQRRRPIAAEASVDWIVTRAKLLIPNRPSFQRSQSNNPAALTKEETESARAKPLCCKGPTHQ